MSHDLKTPLTVILGYVEKLMMDKMMQKEERTIVTHQLYKNRASNRINSSIF